MGELANRMVYVQAGRIKYRYRQIVCKSNWPNMVDVRFEAYNLPTGILSLRTQCAPYPSEHTVDAYIPILDEAIQALRDHHPCFEVTWGDTGVIRQAS